VESLEGETSGLATGYFEPLVEASRRPRPGFQRRPARPAGGPRQPQALLDPAAARHAARPRVARSPAPRSPGCAIRSTPAAAGTGLGRLSFVDAQDKPRELVRMAYAGHNDQPYKSVGRWLVEQGELRLEQASWPAIRAWAKQHPKRRRRDALGQSARRLLPRGAAARSGGRPKGRRACR
jgi:membrane-bound lytic murein transglycosylase A